ncbi:hypothetical protein [Kocuria sabuli]|uniref:hypothetical protein n=1 Tax=Kocuria sabuli TaxID=3071448 RepID=UPI0034D470F2
MQYTPRVATLSRAMPHLLEAQHGRGLFLWFLLGSGVLVLAVLEFPSASLAVASVIALASVLKFVGKSLVSPVLLVSGGLLIVAVAGYILYPALENIPHAAGIRMPADPDILAEGFWALTCASLATSIGALAVVLFTKRPTASLHMGVLHIRRKLRVLLVFATAVPTAMLIGVRGIDNLLERGTYLPEDSAGGFGGALSLAGIVSMVICGYLLHTERRVAWLFVLVNVMAFTTLMLSTGSRRFAAIPVLLAIGYYVARHDKVSSRILAMGGVAALFLVPLPLYWRTLDLHGLIPYLKSLDDYFGADLGLGTAAKTVLISVPLIGSTVNLRFPSGALSTSLDPRTGESAGWYDIAQSMRLNAFTPTPGVGELLHHGTTALVVFFLVIGVYLCLLDRHLRELNTRGHQLIAFAHLGLVTLFLLYVIQYNLRSSVRMLYYSLALLVAYVIWWRVVRPLFLRQSLRKFSPCRTTSLPLGRLNTTS